MTIQKPRLNWDRLLDGATYVLDLDEIGWDRGLADLRAKIHYEVDRRRGVAHTRKVDATTLEFYAEDVRVRTPEGPCSCGAEVWELHVITCTSLGKKAPARKAAPAPRPDPWAFRQDSAPVTPPAPQSEPAPAPKPPYVLAGMTAPGERPVWPAYGTWPPQPEGEDPRIFETEEELEAWEEEVEVLRLAAVAEANRQALGPCTCGLDPECSDECARIAG